MMKLKHLFDNRDLAEMLLQNWEHDESSLDMLRISANAVYKFNKNGVPDEILETILIFRRFANLFCYARISRSIPERWDNEPEWLVKLRLILKKALNERMINFGKKIEHNGFCLC